MHFYSFAIVTGLAGLTAAKVCRNMTVPVSISARQAYYNIAVPQTNLEVTDFILNLTKQGQNFTNVAVAGYDTTAGNYSISAMFCKPSNDNSSNPTVQILTHGFGFDKTYWDLPYNNFNYSYIDVATDQYKYCTLSYDRLGIGNSSHGEPLNEIQAQIEVAALYALTQMLRAGTYPGVNHAFKKVVHVGHSFGSAQTYALVNLYPTASDGIVLTGFSMNATFTGLFAAGANFVLASLNQPLRFGNVNLVALESLLANFAGPLFDYIAPVDLTTLPSGENLPNGYIIPSDIQANKYLFLKSKFYDPLILDLAERTKQPVTLGEILTLGTGPMVNAYAGPVLVLTGDSDVPYCGGDCLATGNPALASIPAAVAKNFPNVATCNFTAYIQPNMGHGINLHYNATGSYAVVQDFLNAKGLRTSNN